MIQCNGINMLQCNTLRYITIQFNVKKKKKKKNKEKNNSKKYKRIKESLLFCIMLI